MTDNGGYPSYSTEAGMLLGVAIRLLVDAGVDDADVMAAVSAMLMVVHDPLKAGPGASKFAEGAEEMGRAVTELMQREDPNDR